MGQAGGAVVGKQLYRRIAQLDAASLGVWFAPLLNAGSVVMVER
jgi:hypothetical protein